ncbi:MAG: type I DNA topoisomerase [Clostridia bacterium]|nr:type I DNA topoisomerase [Clostridia bacterium]
MKLVVIEGPGKRETIQKYLGSDYEVVASKGHVRDLPVHTLGVDIENNFEPKYEQMPDKKDVIKTLKNKASRATQVLLATDPDREGEAISWHIANILELNPKDNIRIEFNEISKNAINHALTQPRPINDDLVNAQQARRVLDRIVGYKLSPIISQKIQPKLSAGRVQSVALELVVDREREIQNFKPEESWAINAELSKTAGSDIHFKAMLNAYNGKKLKIANAEQKDKVLAIVKDKPWCVSSIKRSVTHTHAPAPYITSTMQQDALNKAGMSLKRTTAAAQNLYEGVEVKGKGKIALITYIRTDSVRVSPEAQAKAKEYIISHYGANYYPDKPNVYTSKKSAQDAHEAIRPIYLDITPEDVKYIAPDNYKLYKLIYERFLASQMKEASYNSVSLDVNVDKFTFHATGRTPIFPGYTVIYQDYKSKDDAKNEEEASTTLPELTQNEQLVCHGIKADQKFSKPPARYTEASLVKAMEEKGIGRPATYAPTILVLTSREYVVREGKYLKPSDLGCQVVDTLVKYFPDIMDIKFTARMEDRLDEVADGKEKWQEAIADFYKGFAIAVQNAHDGQKMPAEETDEICDKCGSKMVVRVSKFGKFLACSNYPECKNIKNFATNENGEIILPQETDEICDKCGSKMAIKVGKFGQFLACTNYPACKNIKAINKIVGVCPKCGGDIVEKTSKKGNKFFGCNNYPKCDYVTWDCPTNQHCPNCDGVLYKKEGKSVSKLYCINSKCGYSKPIKNEEKQVSEQ